MVHGARWCRMVRRLSSRPRRLSCRPAVDAKVYGRCELVQKLRQLGSYESHLATWACIVDHESRYDSAAQGRLNADGSIDHGIFQISDLYWCGKWSAGGSCWLTCDSLRDDDIANDFQCVKQIWNEHQRLQGNGFRAWSVYQPYCAGDNSAYVAGC